MSKYRSDYETEIFQCEACGRIKINKDRYDTRYYSFKPEDDPWVKVLEGLSKKDNKQEK